MKFIFTLMLMALPPAAAAQTNVTVTPPDHVPDHQGFRRERLLDG